MSKDREAELVCVHRDVARVAGALATALARRRLSARATADWATTLRAAAEQLEQMQ